MNEIEIPYAPIAEKSVLSCILHDHRMLARAAAEGVDREAFHIPAHRIILAAMRDAIDDNQLDGDEICIATLVQRAALEGNLDSMGGPGAIAEIASYALGPAGWTQWCEMLRECKARRLAITASQSLSEAVDGEDAIKRASEALEAIRGAMTAKTRSIASREACAAFVERYMATYQGDPDVAPVPTGIAEIDAITRGAKPGELWVVGGPSSSGKSALMYQIAGEFLGAGKSVAIFSAELMSHEIIGRLVCLRARVPYGIITAPVKGEITQQDIQRIQRAVSEIGEMPLWVDASGSQSIETVCAEAERIRDIQGPIDLILVDYIQIIRGIRGRGDSREQEIASISGGLKQLAKAMHCPVLTGSQLNDDGKTRESRAIEQDSDVLMIISEAGLKMHKVRNGPRGEVLPIGLDGENQRFRYLVAH
jgi:replicative DNA helicase